MAGGFISDLAGPKRYCFRCRRGYAYHAIYPLMVHEFVFFSAANDRRRILRITNEAPQWHVIALKQSSNPPHSEEHHNFLISTEEWVRLFSMLHGCCFEDWEGSYDWPLLNGEFYSLILRFDNPFSNTEEKYLSAGSARGPLTLPKFARLLNASLHTDFLCP